MLEFGNYGFKCPSDLLLEKSHYYLPQVYRGNYLFGKDLFGFVYKSFESSLYIVLQVFFNQTKTKSILLFQKLLKDEVFITQSKQQERSDNKVTTKHFIWPVFWVDLALTRIATSKILKWIDFWGLLVLCHKTYLNRILRNSIFRSLLASLSLPLEVLLREKKKKKAKTKVNLRKSFCAL